MTEPLITDTSYQSTVVTWGPAPRPVERTGAEAPGASGDVKDAFQRSADPGLAARVIEAQRPISDLVPPGTPRAKSLREVGHQLGNLLDREVVDSAAVRKLVEDVHQRAKASRGDQVNELHALARLMVADGTHHLLREKTDLDDPDRKAINELVGNHLRTAEIEHDNLTVAAYRLRTAELKPVYPAQRVGSDHARLAELDRRLSAFLHREIFPNGRSPYQGIAIQTARGRGKVDKFDAFLVPKGDGEPIALVTGYSLRDSEGRPFSTDYLLANVTKHILEQVGVPPNRPDWPAFLPMLAELSPDKSVERLSPKKDRDGEVRITVPEAAMGKLLGVDATKALREAERVLHSIGVAPVVRKRGLDIEISAEQAKLLITARDLNAGLERAIGSALPRKWQVVRVVNGEVRFVLPSDLDSGDLDKLGRMRMIRKELTPKESAAPTDAQVLSKQLQNLTGAPGRPQVVVGAGGEPEAYALSLDQARRLFAATFPDFHGTADPAAFNTPHAYWSMRFDELVYEPFELVNSDDRKERAKGREAEQVIRETLNRWGFDGASAKLITTDAGAQALVATNGDIVLAVLRGTDDLQAAVTDGTALTRDMRIEGTKLSEAAKAKLATGGLFTGEEMAEAEVGGLKIGAHLGFRDYAESLRTADIDPNNDIIDAIRELNRNNTVPTGVSGHSLGGAANKLVYLMADAEGILLHSSYGSEGARAVGEDGVLLAVARGLAPQTWNVAVKGDPVPGVPTHFMGFRDFGRRVVIDPDYDGVVWDMTPEEYFSEARVSRLTRHMNGNLLPIAARAFLERAIMPPRGVPPAEVIYPVGSPEAMTDKVLRALEQQPEVADDGALVIRGNPVVTAPAEYQQRDAHTLDVDYDGWENFGNWFNDTMGRLGKKIDGVREALEGRTRRFRRAVQRKGSALTIQDLAALKGDLDPVSQRLLFPPRGPLGYVPKGEPVDEAKASQRLALERYIFRALALDATEPSHYVEAPARGPGVKEFSGGPFYRALRDDAVWVDLDGDNETFTKAERLIKYGMTALLKADVAEPRAYREKWAQRLQAVGHEKLKALLGDKDAEGTLHWLRAHDGKVSPTARQALEPKLRELFAKVEATGLFAGVGEQYTPIWQALIRRYVFNESLIEIRQPPDLRGELGSDYGRRTPFEQETRANIEDLRNNNNYLKLGLTSETTLNRDLLPDLEKRGRNEALTRREALRYLLTPPWLTESRADSAIADGWDAHPDDVVKAATMLSDIGDESMDDFIDLANALSTDVLSGTETHWQALIDDLFSEPMQRWSALRDPRRPHGFLRLSAGDRDEQWNRLQDLLARAWVRSRSDTHEAGRYRRRASFDVVVKTTLRRLAPERRAALLARIERHAGTAHAAAIAKLRNSVLNTELQQLLRAVGNFSRFLSEADDLTVARRYADEISTITDAELPQLLEQARASDRTAQGRLQAIDDRLGRLAEALATRPELASKVFVSSTHGQHSIGSYVAGLRKEIAGVLEPTKQKSNA